MATQGQILTVLALGAGPMRQVEVGNKLGIKVSSFSGQLRALEKQGFVLCDKDGAFTITDAGRAALLKTGGTLQTSAGSRFQLSITEADLANLEEAEFYQVWEALGKIVRSAIVL